MIQQVYPGDLTCTTAQRDEAMHPAGSCFRMGDDYNARLSCVSSTTESVDAVTDYIPAVTVEQAYDRQYEWQCFDNLQPGDNPTTPVRRNRETGNIECMSRDAFVCEWGPKQHCEDLISNPPPEAGLKNLQCGPMHAAAGWGGDGYTTPGHWCQKVNKALPGPRAWPAPAQWVCLGDGTITPVRRNLVTNDIECFSTDATNCLWSTKQVCEIVRDAASHDDLHVRPLICGVQHSSIYGITGYDTPGHWCQTSNEQLP